MVGAKCISDLKQVGSSKGVMARTVQCRNEPKWKNFHAKLFVSLSEKSITRGLYYVLNRVGAINVV